MENEKETILHDGEGPSDLRRIHAVLRVLQGGDVGREYPLRKPEYIIGRDHGADIHLPMDYVSRRHAKIRVTCTEESAGNTYVVTDMSSRNRTYVNLRLAEDLVLEDGDKIIIGDTILRFELLDEIDLKFHKDIRRKIRYDDLTQLLTKGAFTLALNRELQHCRQYRLPLSVMMADIDFFKKVNDTYGHQTGDHVLRVIGKLIGDNPGRTDVFARYGGEEFAGYLPDRGKEAALLCAENIRKIVESTPIDYEGKELSVTISVGVSGYPADGATCKELIGRADEALYQAKETGRNRACLF